MLLRIFWWNWIIYIWERIGGNFISVTDVSPGVISTVLCGKHCNRCQTLHKTFTIALERLYLHTTCAIDLPKERSVLFTMKNLIRLDLLNS